MCPIVLEKALKKDPTLIGTFSPSGDSMIYVDKTGKRVTNEKLAYNESAQAFFKWDPVEVASIRTSSSSRSGTSAARTIRRATSTAASSCRRASTTRHVIKGKTLGGARRQHQEARSKQYAGETGDLQARAGLRQEPEGDASRASTASRGRARTSTSTAASGRSSCCSTARPRPKTGKNPTMYPISGEGPVLRGAADRRQPRHQGRPGDQRQRPGARRRSASRSPASTAPATASPRPRRAPTGPAARRSDRSSPSPISRPTRRIARPSK